MVQNDNVLRLVRVESQLGKSKLDLIAGMKSARKAASPRDRATAEKSLRIAKERMRVFEAEKRMLFAIGAQKVTPAAAG